MVTIRTKPLSFRSRKERLFPLHVQKLFLVKEKKQDDQMYFGRYEDFCIGRQRDS